MHRIKAFTPVSVLLVSAAFRLKELNQKILAIVACISLGVAIASYGELEFELIGFLVQVSRSAHRRLRRCHTTQRQSHAHVIPLYRLSLSVSSRAGWCSSRSSCRASDWTPSPRSTTWLRCAWPSTRERPPCCSDLDLR